MSLNGDVYVYRYMFICVFMFVLYIFQGIFDVFHFPQKISNHDKFVSFDTHGLDMACLVQLFSHMSCWHPRII